MSARPASEPDLELEWCVKNIQCAFQKSKCVQPVRVRIGATSSDMPRVSDRDSDFHSE